MAKDEQELQKDLVDKQAEIVQQPLNDVELQEVEHEPLGELVELKLDVQFNEETPREVQKAFNTVESLERIVEVQSTLDGMRNNLSKVIEAMDNNPSVFSQWANYWGESSLVAKIGSGALVIAPTLIIGLAASIPGLVFISGGTALAYSGAGVLLGDHYQHTADNKIQLKEGVIGLISLFESVIMALEQLRHKLAMEVDRLSGENDKLVTNIQMLHGKVEQLTDQVEELAGAVDKHKANNEELRLVTTELQETKEELNKQVIGATAAATAMNSVMNVMIQNQSLSAEQQEAFDNKLQSFLSNKEATFDRLATRVCQAEEELVIVNRSLENSSRQYALLNRDHKALVVRMEKVLSHPAVRNLESEQLSMAKGLGDFGIHNSCAQESKQQKVDKVSSEKTVGVTI